MFRNILKDSPNKTAFLVAKTPDGGPEEHAVKFSGQNLNTAVGSWHAFTPKPPATPIGFTGGLTARLESRNSPAMPTPSAKGTGWSRNLPKARTSPR